MSKVNLWLDEKDVAVLSKLLANADLYELKETIDGQAQASSQFVEKAKEYQQVAALLSLDIDTIYEIAHSTTNPVAKDLVGQIDLLYKDKEETVRNKESRERRYNAASFLFGLPTGSIRSDKIG